MDNLMHIMTTYGVPRRSIEIGTYEGYTSLWLSDIFVKNGFKDSKIYAIDPHVGSDDLPEIDFQVTKDNFDYNLSVNGNNNIVYIQKNSTSALIELLASGETPMDLIYIDGDHRANQVLADLVLSWQLLDRGGVILCDDCTDWKYTDNNGISAAQMSPRMAVEAFIQCNWHNLKIIKLPNSSQTAFRKLS
jgi:predicted O-methyltransferase YrrM